MSGRPTFLSGCPTFLFSCPTFLSVSTDYLAEFVDWNEVWSISISLENAENACYSRRRQRFVLLLCDNACKKDFGSNNIGCRKENLDFLSVAIAGESRQDKTRQTTYKYNY